VRRQIIRFQKRPRGNGLLMKVALSWQKKAVILLSLSLVLLSVILAGMAIREAERSRLVSEREAETAHKQAAALVSDRARSVLSGLESRVLRVLPPSRPGLSPEEMAAASRLILEDPENGALLSEVFVLDAAGNITYPAARPLFLFPGERANLQEIPPELASHELWREAEDAEFKRRDHAQAAASYQRLLARFADQGSRSFILSRLGRCCEKAGNSQRALAAFQEILGAGRPELSSDGIPLELMAIIQMGDIHLKLNRPAEAAASFLRLYEDLLTAKWALTRSRFEFYRERAEQQIQTIQARLKSKEVDDRWSQLKSREAAGLRRMARLENIRRGIVPLILPGLRASMDSRPRFSRLSALPGGELLLVSYCSLNDSAVLGLVISPDQLTGQLLPVDPGPSILQAGWIIRLEDESGRLVAGRELAPPRAQAAASPPSYSGAFENDFPPWNISIYRTGPDRSLRDFRVRRAIYILLVAVVMTALFLGGYLVIRSTAKEFELARLKSDFVATVSHDFRTPLTSIRYLAELLERGRVKDEERKREYFRTIGSESERLSRLVENILDFSKIEAGMKEFRMEGVDIGALMRDVATRFLGQATDKRVALETEIPEGLPWITADPEALSRAVLNLLDNAAKYSSDGPRIALRVRAEADGICLEIEDQGIGISPADQKKVFEKFFRSKAATASTVRGSGIGLTLVEHIIKAHGGRVALESELGQGTKVAIHLPAQQPR
jgi:signal transduction histidine kinase/tetratricopeptide (TPR) repeat protein